MARCRTLVAVPDSALLNCTSNVCHGFAALTYEVPPPPPCPPPPLSSTHTRHRTRVRAQVPVGLPWSRCFCSSGKQV